MPIFSHLRPLLLALCLASQALTLAAQSPTGTETPLTPEARSAALDALAPEYLDWLRSVRGLMTQPELDHFLRLREDFRRDAFMRAFWEPRDPDPGTPQNELRDRWEQYRDSPGGPPYGDPRFLLLLFNGPPGGWLLPDGRPVGRCFSRHKALEIWFYGASERTERRFPVILMRRGSEVPYEVYLPGTNFRPMQRSGGLPTTNLSQLCADELLRYTVGEINRITGYDRLIREVLAPLLPSPEWLANLAASATDLPPGAETFEVEVDLAFPARKQSRSAVRLILDVPLAAAPGRRFDGELFHNFSLVGEVIRRGQLFETFRYRFEGPTPEAADAIPVGFTRYLRPGTVELRILLEDLYGDRFARVVREIDVPPPDGLPPVAVAEATATTGPALELVQPSGNVHVGKIRFRARSLGEIDKVTFYLDDKPVLSKRRPPYSVELDLGESPQPRRVRVVGFVDDREVATDQLWLNQGAQRFRVLLAEPRPGGIYPGGFTARVQVETPDGAAPERVELYLDDRLAATLDEPPFTHPVRHDGGELTVVRAVAHLAGGGSAEDVVVVGGAAALVEEIEVRLVELEVLVTDAAGQPIAGLGRESFTVLEDGAPRTIQRFEASRDAPITAALLIDRSISMEPHLAVVAEAARRFATAALRSPEDRVAVLSFADDLTVDAGFAAGSGALERALAGLDAGGGTRFYDGLVQALNTFEGIRGLSAMVVFTDGQDESSRLSFEQALATARRAGSTLYAIGLAAAFPDPASRRGLERLTDETGGRAHFIAGLDELPGVYLGILEELRSRYRLAFQPGDETVAGIRAAGGPEGFREIDVDVDVKGARVRTRSGYHP